jgi:hypothetical protein
MRAPRGAAAVLAVLAVTLMAAAGDDLRREIDVAASRARIGGPPDGCAVPVDEVLHGEPRALVADALCIARAAAPLSAGPRRNALLSSAAARLREAERARPIWPEALTVSAYVGSLAGDEASLAEARRSLTLSYAGAPYLPDAADWRIGFGLSQWADLGVSARDAVVAEAMWRMTIAPDSGPKLWSQMRASPAYVPFMLRWRASAIEWDRYTKGLAPG